MSTESKDKQSRQVVFRRVGGRIVPIAMTAGGGYAAFDAARTRRVYSNATSKVTIDRKLLSPQPFRPWEIGTTLVGKKNGKKFGSASFGIYDKADKSFGFSWLGVKREFRGKGYSNILTKQSAVEIKRQGGKSLFNQVVHKNSLLTNYDRTRDTLFRESRGGTAFKKITKKEAFANLKYWRDKRGILTSNIFRETKLPKSGLRPSIKPFMTQGNKVKLAVGLALASAGALSWKNQTK